jgi:hypothetical protein
MPWKEITEKQYNDALEVLPPALWLANRFLMGEPSDHRRCKITKNFLPVYAAFVFAFGRYYEGSPMTTHEFRAFKDDELPLPR